MFLFSHPRELAFSPRKFSNQYNILCENKSSMVGEVVVKLPYNYRDLGFPTHITRPLIYKGFFSSLSYQSDV